MTLLSFASGTHNIDLHGDLIKRTKPSLAHHGGHGIGIVAGKQIRRGHTQLFVRVPNPAVGPCGGEVITTASRAPFFFCDDPIHDLCHRVNQSKVVISPTDHNNAWPLCEDVIPFRHVILRGASPGNSLAQCRAIIDRDVLRDLCSQRN